MYSYSMIYSGNTSSWSNKYHSHCLELHSQVKLSLRASAMKKKQKQLASSENGIYVICEQRIQNIINTTRQSEGQLYPPPQNDNGAVSKFKVQTGGLQLWPSPSVCIVELWVLHIISLRRTFDPNLINIFQRVQEIWSEHEIQGFNCDLDPESACLSYGFCTLPH